MAPDKRVPHYFGKNTPKSGYQHSKYVVFEGLFKMCWQTYISCNILKQQLACLTGDLCCVTGLSNHLEAAVAERWESLRG